MNTNNPKPRALCFTSRFPRWQGDSVCSFVYYLARELTKHFEVFVLTSHDHGIKVAEEMDGIHVRRFKYFWPAKLQRLSNEDGLMANIKDSLLAKIQVPIFMLLELIALIRIIKKEKIEVVNSHWMIPQGLVAAIARKFVPFRHVVTIHAGDIFALRRWPFGKKLAKFIAKNTDSFLPVSSLNMDVLEELLGEKPKGQVLPMGVDTGYFLPGEDKKSLREKLDIPFEKMILFVGRLSEKKGIGFLIKAMAEVHPVRSSPRETVNISPGELSHGVNGTLDNSGLVVVGGGPLDQQLVNETRALGIAEKVLFTGTKNHEQLRDYYAAADIAVIPSIVDSRGDTEGVPVVLLESLSSGLPVIATSVGGIPDVIENGENGFLIDEKSSEQIAEALQSYFANQQAMSEKALATARQFDWAQIGLGYKRAMASQ